LNTILIHKNNNGIESIDDWFQFAPPKEGLRQWKDGRSAKELAKAWFPQPGKPHIPEDLSFLLNSHPDLTGIEILEGIPEHKISLDNFRGETRNADLVLVGKKGESKVSINIEAKVDEPYDLTIIEKFGSVKNPRSKIPDRINLLCRALLGETPESNSGLLKLRYQLLTGCAGTLIEADRIGAIKAVFVVHVFLSDAVNKEKIKSNDEDFIHFMRYFGCHDDEIIDDSVLIGPLKVPGGTFVPSKMPLYVGRIKTQLTGLLC